MNVIEGLNKVDCFVTSAAHNGKTVTISNTNNTWSGVLADNHAVFMIPNIPAPAKQTYTVALHNGDASADAMYTRDIELGFGDSIKVGLGLAEEPAKRGEIFDLSAELNEVETDLEEKITYGRTDLAAGSSYLKTGTIYCYY